MSKLPSWIHVQHQRALQKLENQKKAIGRNVLAQFPVADSFHTAPGWRDLGQEFQLLEDAEYPRDPMVTKAIKEFDSSIVPLWCKWKFMSPADTGNPQVVVFGRHAVGHFIDSPNTAKAPVPGLISLVNQVDFIWDGTVFGLHDPRARDLPGPFLPWDWRLLSFCREAYSRNLSVEQQKIKYVRDPIARQMQEKESFWAAENDKKAEIEKFVQKKMDQASELETKEYFMSKVRSTRAGG